MLGLNATAPRLKGFTLKWLRFSRGPIGNGVFIVTKKQSTPVISYVTPFTVTMLPILFAFLISYMFSRKWKQVDK